MIPPLCLKFGKCMLGWCDFLSRLKEMQVGSRARLVWSMGARLFPSVLRCLGRRVFGEEKAEKTRSGLPLFPLKCGVSAGTSKTALPASSLDVNDVLPHEDPPEFLATFPRVFGTFSFSDVRRT